MGDPASALLRDLLAATKDGDWGRDSPANGYIPYRVIRGTDFPRIRAGDVSTVPVRYLDESTVHRRTLEPDDILLETAGGSPDRPTGRSLLITKGLLSRLDLPATCASFSRFLRVDRGKADPRYVYWYLQLLYANGEMEQHQVQHTGVARFQYTKFAETERVPLPPVHEQNAIAQILSVPDEKIELNQRMNQTLEAIARAIFKSWFVDFDPVRAKAEGREPYGMDAATAELFPDAFEGSTLSRIPKGWNMTPLSKVVSYLRRGIQPAYTDSNGVTVINQKCIRDGRIDLSQARRHDLARRAVKGREVLKGDALINSTGVGTLGRVAQVMSLNEPMIVDSHVTIARTEPSALTWNMLGLTLMSRQDEIESLGEGTTGQTELNRERLKSIPLLVPPMVIQEKFDECVLPLRELAVANDAQSLTLAAIRDTLLPKLMSGEISLGDTEEMIEKGTGGENGWSVDHRNPISKGGTDHRRNLRALHTETNEREGNRRR